MGCLERERLAGAASKTLRQIMELSEQMLEAVQGGRLQWFSELDRQLELAVGEKERSFGALRQHEKEHACLTGTAER